MTDELRTLLERLQRDGVDAGRQQADAAVAQAREVARTVRRWTTHFANEGVSARDLEYHEAQIDRPFLREQRNELIKGDTA